MPSSALEPQTLSLGVFLTAHFASDWRCNGAGYSRFRASDLTPRNSGTYTRTRADKTKRLSQFGLSYQSDRMTRQPPQA
jgi:hypothetical protein